VPAVEGLRPSAAGAPFRHSSSCWRCSRSSCSPSRRSESPAVPSRRRPR